MRSRFRGLSLLLAGLVAVSSLFLRPSSSANAVNQTESDTQDVFTPAHRTVLDSVREFMGWRNHPVQPFAFTHKKHIENQIVCDACHNGVNQGPRAGIPNINVCMRCHTFFAKDRPEIKKLAGIFDSGLDIEWQRVYEFSPSAHVKFNHAPHIHAGIDCSACHGDLKTMTVAVRAVNLNMGFCLSCHRAKQVSTDCVTCHF